MGDIVGICHCLLSHKINLFRRDQQLEINCVFFYLSLVPVCQSFYHIIQLSMLISTTMMMVMIDMIMSRNEY